MTTGIFQGRWPALMTPFTSQDTVNVEVLLGLVDYLLDKEVDGFYVCGNTGQGVSMTVGERQTVAEKVIQHVNMRVPVIVHVGSPRLQESITLAIHARKIGAAGTSSIIPPGLEGISQITGFFKSVADAGNDLPFFPYIISDANPVHLMREFMNIPQVRGTKFTSHNIYEAQTIVELKKEDWNIFYGMDEQYLYGVMAGASGHIGSQLNFMPGVYRNIYECISNNDVKQALAFQKDANAVTSLLLDYGLPGAMVVIMKTLGFDCDHPRLPHKPLTVNEQDRLIADLEKTNYRNLIAM